MTPTLFVGHGAGPMPLLNHPGHADVVRTWAPGSQLHTAVHDPAVRAIVVVSAHYETSDGAVEVMADPQPGLLFDYTGFPPETYRYALPNPGSAPVAQRIVELLTNAGIPTRTKTGRGHDHGVFVPLLGLGIAADRPTLPVISVSLRGPAHVRVGLTEDHLAMGRALAPLRAEGVLVIGSGNSIHGRCTAAQAKSYDDHLQRLARRGPAAFAEWADHPMVKLAHARPEHLIPLLVAAGAAMQSSVDTVQHEFMGFACTHMLFRDPPSQSASNV